jgi:predicted nucleic acid-binding protein
MNELYFDTSYLCKLRWPEHGSAEVCACAGRANLFTAAHGRAEFHAVGHRKRREGTASPTVVLAINAQFHADIAAGDIRLLPITDAVLDRVETAFANAPIDQFIRAADALHLATAAEHGFAEIYSNDRHLLAAAPIFGLAGVNVIP